MENTKIIEIDLCGAALSQALLDQVVAASAHEPAQVTDIVLRRVSTIGRGLPRIVVDYGQIYEAVELLLAEHNAR